METFKSGYRNGQWYRLRDSVLKRDGYKCVVCGTGEDLQVHHHWYMQGRSAWEYPVDELSTVCGKHHEEITEYQSCLRRYLCRCKPVEFITMVQRIVELDVLNVANRSLRHDGIAISAYNQETERVRLVRLRTVVDLLRDENASCIPMLLALHDHKGTLEVTWGPFAKRSHQKEVDIAWGQVGECSTQHYGIEYHG